MPYKDPKKQKEAARRHYLNNKADYRDRKRKARDRNKQYVLKVKEKSSCSCGESDSNCLDFHHRESKTKVDKVSQLVREAVSLVVLQKEIDKCDLICANCHRKQHSSVDITRQSLVKNWLRDYKKQAVCDVCEESHFACLDFHHRDGEDKLDGLNNLVRKKEVTVELLLTEIDKCDVFCANCHRKHHALERLK
jgi:hypothetical protein